MSEQIQWQSPETAPRDGSVFIADAGYPWAVAAMFSAGMEQFCFADIESSIYRGQRDPSFVTEWMTDGELLGWMPMPAVPERVGVIRRG